LDLLDKAAKPRAVGAGIGFQPIGLTALKKLGLLDTISHHGARIDGIHSTSNGRTVLDVAYSRFHPQLFGLGLHRGVLFESLLAACRAEPGIALQFGVSITSIEQSSDAATLHMENSAKQEAKKLGPYDLVVLADGAHSQLRGVLGIPCWTRRYDYGALFALLPDEKSTFGRTLTQAHGGPGCHETLGFLPTGLPWAGEVDTMVGDDDDDGVVVDRRKADFTTTLYYNLRGEEWDAARASGGFLGSESTEYLGQERQQATTFTTTGGGGGGGGVTVKVGQSGSSAQRLQAWKDKCCRLMPQAADLVQQGVTESKQVSFARYSDSVAWRFHAGRVALVGDCAHAMSPQLGQVKAKVVQTPF
jgi:2-polyprenyl-6-methoxyphenol hydroxylase-like FAD-dependent oxidoreductase